MSHNQLHTPDCKVLYETKMKDKTAAPNLCIQEHHCWPFPKGPPAKMLKMGSILAIAPPSFASTMPVRTMTTLFALACCAAFSQSLHTSAR